MKQVNNPVGQITSRIKNKLIKLIKTPSGDDYGYVIPEPTEGTNPYKYDVIYKQLKAIIGDYDLRQMKKLVGLDFGINPFDLFVLKTFIEKNNVKHVLELGAGTSSVLLDNMNITRKSYALESIFYDAPFEKIDIFAEYPKVQEYIKNSNIDMLVIDCEHSKRMAKLIHTKFLPLLQYSKPMFFHDWQNYDKKTYAEQVYYFHHLLDTYDVTYMTDLPDKYIDKLKRINNQLDNEEYYIKLKLKRGHLPIRRASAILTPLKMKYNL